MREKLIGLLDDALLSVNWDSHDYPDTDSAAEILIANDVVAVVRCKDCEYSRQTQWYSAMLKCCHKSHGSSQVPYEVPLEHFCSYGKRRSTENV